MSLSDSTREKIENIVKQNRVVLFMKGSPKSPMCGFSAKTSGLLNSILDDYKSVDVLEDQEIREGIKVYGNWPTIPQLYIDGELIGGCDIVTAMFNSSELHDLLGVEAPDRTPPEVTITDAAAAKILEAMQGHEGIGLHFAVDANWQSQFNVAPAEGHEIKVVANGITMYFDLASAQRANGAIIDWTSFEHELRRLEKRVDALVRVCDQLQDENKSLKQRQDLLTAERANLLQKNEQVRARVEAMIGRLKAMEQGT